ncbi:hypothetical protein B0T16DRAFT_498298 [Cercophora newfieldiana]|uniref:Uncharacterized protein n=1 Tax=Cercophora newfieldiana TaxID=92897 RepID=A0AA39YNP9_9PEZI|nr:hypothetical protein B0T16DRAFT_498298 [Cercophora newfieldiana]
MKVRLYQAVALLQPAGFAPKGGRYPESPGPEPESMIRRLQRSFREQQNVVAALRQKREELRRQIHTIRTNWLNTAQHVHGQQQELNEVYGPGCFTASADDLTTDATHLRSVIENFVIMHAGEAVSQSMAEICHFLNGPAKAGSDHFSDKEKERLQKWIVGTTQWLVLHATRSSQAQHAGINAWKQSAVRSMLEVIGHNLPCNAPTCIAEALAQIFDLALDLDKKLSQQIQHIEWDYSLSGVYSG